MKEDLICGVAILLYLVLLYLLTTAFIKTGRAIDRYKMKKNYIYVLLRVLKILLKNIF